MTPLRLAFISPRVPSGASVGGAETLLKHLAHLAVELGHKVTLLSTCATDHFTWKNEAEPGKRNVDGLDVELFPVNEDRDFEAYLRIQEMIMRGRKVTLEDERTWLANGVNSDAMLEHLKSRRDDYDLVIAGPYLFGLTVSALEAVADKAILLPCLHDEPFARLKAFDQLFSKVRGVIFNTDPERVFAERITSSPLPNNKVVGFSIEEFNADPALFPQRLPFQNPYIIYCGRREPMKGTPLLLDYVRTFRKRTGTDVSLVLSGKGEVDLEEGDSDWVYDAGFLSEEDKQLAMAGASVFCHPSTYESLGIVILEAWMAGTPALVHAGSEVLTDQCKRGNGGLWFRCYPDFEEELTAILSNESLRRSMGNCGKEFVRKEYSRQAVKQRLQSFLESAKS
jgi:glycosyltransferase involved in cell wall biosynthesis